jgi:hypothetical protein
LEGMIGWIGCRKNVGSLLRGCLSGRMLSSLHFFFSKIAGEENFHNAIPILRIFM